MRAVSDATALIYLLRIGEEGLLESAFTELLLPDGVVEELMGQPSEVRRLEAVPCVRLSPISTGSTARLPAGFEHLHKGEISALRLARHLGIQRVVIDDLAARMAATELGLDVIGLLGILRLLVEADVIPAIRPYADRARAKGFRVNERFYESFLLQMGE